MPRRTRRVGARKLFAFRDVVGHREVRAITAGHRLDPAILSTERSRGSGPPRGPYSPEDRPNRYRIHHREDGLWKSVDLPETTENFHHLQPIGADGWLLVRSMTDALKGDDDQNAHLYRTDGSIVRSFYAGDAIQDIQATEGRTIWISYFDEGVFGPRKFSRSGLVALDERGDCQFEFAELWGEVEPIADCYAFNAAGEDRVWVYYYTGFPLIRLEGRRIAEAWSDCPVKGSSGFAIDADLALFGGGYGDKKCLRLVRLGDQRAEKIIPIDEEERAIEAFEVFGRGPRLFLKTSDDLRAVDLADLLHE